MTRRSAVGPEVCLSDLVLAAGCYIQPGGENGCRNRHTRIPDDTTSFSRTWDGRNAARHRQFAQVEVLPLIVETEAHTEEA